MAQKKKANKEVEELFSADLVLTSINKKEVKFRVEHPQGLKVQNLHHLIMDRLEFPMDDNFNMDFMTADLNNLPRPVDPNEVPDQKSIGALKKKQAEFRKFMNLRVAITAE